MSRPPASASPLGAAPVAALLDGLNPEQHEAVITPHHPLRILAGAGSGKTRVLTRRIAHRVVTDDVDPRHVLALTFTRKAAGELNARLRALGLRDSVAAGTFHGIAYAQLRSRWADRNIKPPVLLDRKLGFLRRMLPPGSDHTQALDLASEIEWAKARAIPPERYERAAAAAGRKSSLTPARVASLFERYEAEKKQRRMVDFDDLLSLCRRAISTDADFAATQRWRFRHFFVDEFQDVNPLQFGLLGAWLGEREDLCVVGDPNQAIYAWNGADADYLVSFATHFAGAHTVELRHNYRSSPEILNAAAGALGPGRLAGHRLVAARPSGPAPHLQQFRTDRDEAVGIARAVRDARAPGQRWSAQAVLVRTNAQIPLLDEALRAAGIPCRTRGGGLLALPEIKSALAGLEASRAPLGVALADLEGDARTDDDTEISAAEIDRRANRAALVRLGHDLLAVDPAATAGSFVAWARAAASTDQISAGGDAVDVLTFHAAKGLEWPVVHLAGVEDGLVPIGHAKRDIEIAEERRLFYVACTRAEAQLRITWAEQRTFGTRAMHRSRSPWLDDVEIANGGSPRVAAARTAANARGRVASPSSGRRNRPAAPEGPLLTALKQWRSTAARAANVPAYVIFADATLEAVAEARPSTPADLRGLTGIGPVKLERYGALLLELVRDHAEP